MSEHLPYEWIEDALSYTGRASIRQRRLPAHQVVWLVISLALFRHRSVRQVVAELDLALPDLADRCVTDSAVTQARQRLGEDPPCLAIHDLRASLVHPRRAQPSLRWAASSGNGWDVSKAR